MIPTGKPFNTNSFFSGGAGLFIEYHDVVKPVYLYSIIKMILTKTSYGLTLEIISSMSIFSLIEWYIKRRYINPLTSLDYKHILSHEDLDNLLYKILEEDSSLYSLAPSLNIKKLLSSYKSQFMNFPIYVYSKKYESHIKNDIKECFSGLPTKYIYGDLSKAISKCDRNFTYILSNIELLKELINLLSDTWAHLLISKEYLYNYKDNYKTFKYDLKKLHEINEYNRISLTTSIDLSNLFISCAETVNGRIVNDTN
jgi:hypothetical protein